MTIASETEQLQTNLENSYTAVSNKGGTLPQDQCFDNLPNAISSITELKGETKTVNPSTSQQVITPSSGKNGITQVTVNAVTSAIDQDIIPSNIKSGVEILGITGNYAGQGATIDSLNVTPSTSAQTITATGGVDGYNPVNVSAVTASIDSNIKPQFIRNGVEILSIVGTYGEPLPYLLSVSSDTTWYITNSGELYGCGYNSAGQQSIGTTTPYSIDTFTKRADNVIQIAIGKDGSTTWYVNSIGELYGCGAGGNGQQGSNATSNVTTFTKRADNVVQIACSDNTTWYINSSGKLYGCGQNPYGQQGTTFKPVKTFSKRADNVVQIACSDNTTWYINESGELYGCGYNNVGQQGAGSIIKTSTFTKRADNVVQVACTNYTTWYINSNGELYGCGNNTYGNQGSGNTTIVTTFTKRADNVVQVACTNRETWYINSSGELYGCGNNSYGQQGSGDTTDVTTFTKRADNVVEVACGQGETWYINSSDELYGCGRNNKGQQGSGDTTDVTTFTKRADNVVEVACSDNTSANGTTWYVNNSNEVYGCGYNNNGQQGSGTSGSGTDVLTFTKRN